MSKQHEEVNSQTQLPLLKETQKLWYAAKQLVVCSIPQRQLLDSSGAKITEYSRRNGKFFLELVATKPKLYGIPYGRDRHFFYWLRTKATQQKSPIVKFKDGSSILEEMGFTVTGKNIAWLKEAVMRSHHTLVYYVEGDPLDGGSSRGELIIPSINGFYDLSEYNPKRPPSFEVSKHFFEQSHIPIDQNIIKKLGRHFTAMDLYTFARLRLHGVIEDGSKIIFPLSDLRKHFGTSESIPDRQFKRDIEEAIKALKKVGFDVVPSVDKKNNIVFPKKRPRHVLTSAMQEAFKKLD